MKKNMLIIMLMISLFSAKSSMTMEKLSSSSRNFIEHSKKQGMRFYFVQGTLRDDWISQAIDAILDGSQVKVGNKNYLIEQLNIMVDILIGEPLSRNPNITHAQYQELIRNIQKKIQFTIDLKCLSRS